MANKTKKALLIELKALRDRVSELESREKDFKLNLSDLGERADRSFPHMGQMEEAIFVVFDRKLEFVNDRFAELFGFSKEEACKSDFNLMSLIAPESRQFIRDQYREVCHGSHVEKRLKFCGRSKNGEIIECESFLVLIPYKWGIAIHGMLRRVPVNVQIDEMLQQRLGHLRVILDNNPTDAFYTESNSRSQPLHSAAHS
jgi:PAS domain S-box-containing protein